MARPLRIAVADDEVVMQMYFEETLVSFGHEVVIVAQNGRDLLERWEAQPADLVITDIKMPVMDGLAAIRAIYRSRVVPVVFLTGYNSLVDVARDDAEFVHVYLVKPIGAKDLCNAIDAALRLSDEFQWTAGEAGDNQRALRDRRVIEKAKKTLTAGNAADEHNAFERLRALAAANNRTLAATAEGLLAQDTEQL